jgi:hypothetical protein
LNWKLTTGNLAALALYIVAAIAMTWPVARGVSDHIAIDLGDPAFVSFVISWGSQHWLELLSGDSTAATRFWSAPIFYPEPLTTAYSEHFALHSLLTLPVYAVTQNAILCYNLWFLGSFALAGFSMFLLALRLAPTDSARSGQARLPLGAFVAGLAFAFAPYRFASLSHLQVLSSFWMPLVLLGLHQFFEDGRKRWLVLACAALWAQCLASGYYLVFFTPFAALFALIELTVRRRLADVRAGMALGIAAAVTMTAVLPFVWPYLEVQRVLDLKRPLIEIETYSADLAAWLTANPELHFWGWLRPFNKGWLFPGLATLAMVIFGLAIAVRRLRSTDPALRARAAIVLWFSVITTAVTVWITLGPAPRLMGTPLGIPPLFRALYDYAPGFDAARVPIRMAMVTAVATSLLAALAAAALDRPGRRWLLVAVALLILADSALMPLPVDFSVASVRNLQPPGRLFSARDAPPIYKYLKTLPATAVIAELPFGAPEWEIQYTYYSAVHRRRIANGYSGFFPESYRNRFRPLEHPERTFGTMYTRLKEDGITHVVVHVDAWRDGAGARVVEIFEGTGFPRLARFGNDHVFLLALQK